MPPKVLIPMHRLEALADGVFAIAMTILVLEVKVPDLANPRSAEDLLNHLSHAWPTLGAYFVSFFMLGLFWFWHHRIMAKLRRLDLPLIAMSLCFLALVSFFPFAAALLGRYPTNPVALMVYLPVMGLLLTLQAATLGMARRRNLVDSDGAPEEIRQAQRRNLLGCALFFMAALPSAARLGWVSALLCLGTSITFFWFRSRVR